MYKLSPFYAWQITLNSRPIIGFVICPIS